VPQDLYHLVVILIKVCCVVFSVAYLDTAGCLKQYPALNSGCYYCSGKATGHGDTLHMKVFCHLARFHMNVIDVSKTTPISGPVLAEMSKCK
jgi:hypothetical protein